MKYIKKFNLNESHLIIELNQLVDSIISKIKDFNQVNNSYFHISEIDFNNKTLFDLNIFIKKEKNPELELDPHFKDLAWEQHNFSDLGFAINAITKFNNKQYFIPEIDLYLILNPFHNNVYTNLKSRMYGILMHELTHVEQKGLNRKPHNVHTSSTKVRSKAASNYKYFLLDEEIDAMIHGKYAQSKIENKPLDEIFINYLMPFIKDDFMNEDQFNIVLATWVKRAIELYPNANFSKKVENIINNI